MKSSLLNSESRRLIKFREMIAIGFLCVTLVLGLAGCVTMATNPGIGFTPNEQEGIVFGQMQLLDDGNLVRYNARTFFGIAYPQMIQTHVSQFSDVQSVSLNQWLPAEKQHSFLTQIADDGYFSVKLPVGRYYINSFGYFLPEYLPFPKGWSTYMSLMGITPSDPKVVIFDVLPNQATYIGTFIHRSDSADGQSNSRKRNFKLKVVDEYEKCKSVFLAKHPQIGQSVVSRIATFIPYENQKQKAKDTVDQKKREQATKDAVDEFRAIANDAVIKADKITSNP